ncbi:hypothetical protein TWF694_002066 [Orbilia ellipsospora]|uniref:feruloyl esterase n=1 Tax=Orbilia ellipsospora TaxID=2528407 RepID=A0AAV9X709_9PEZI
MARLLSPILLSLLLKDVLAQTAGCGKNATKAVIGNIGAVNITSSKMTRSFYLNLPPDYDPNTPHAAVFGFHGSGVNGLLFEADTRLSDPQFATDKILVYPNGLNDVWATGVDAAGATPLDWDLTFIQDLLDNLRENYCIDDQRIYATGISNGGGFVNRIACSPSLGANFAAFAPVSGAYTGYEQNSTGNSTCDPFKLPTPILSIHGGNDTTVPYNGRNSSINSTDIIATPPIEYWLQGWIDRNDCTNQTETTNGTVHHFTWTCAGVESAMEHYKVDNMGHYWPSTTPTFSQVSAGAPPTPIDGNTLIIAFFDRFTKNVTGTATSPSSTQSGGPSTTSGGTTTSAAGSGTGAAGRIDISLANVGLAVMISIFGGLGFVMV